MSEVEFRSYGDSAELRDDPRRTLVNRIVSSESFARSRRLRQLFVYLSECALRSPESLLTEQQVGVAVFNRPAGYDTTADTVVRVRASEIRKRLKYYFLTEGSHEPLIVNLPKGSYLPVFVPREPLEVHTSHTDLSHSEARRVETSADATHPGEIIQDQVLPSPVTDTTSHALNGHPPNQALETLPQKQPSPAASRVSVKQPGFKLTIALASLLLIMTGLAAWLAHENARLRKASEAAANATPFLSHFWNQFFQNGKPTELIPSDGDAVALADVLGRNISLREYSDPAYPRTLLDPLIHDQKIAGYLTRAVNMGGTPPYDTLILHDISTLASRYQISLQVVFPRKAKLKADSPGNLILLGHDRVNPWVELFQSRLNFRHQYDDLSRKAMIVNTSPLPGEEPTYVSERANEDFAVVACLPKPNGGGNVLLIFGGRMAAIDGAASVVTNEAQMAKLYSRLGVGVSGHLPYFEALLDRRSTGSVYEIIAHRVIQVPNQ